MDVKQVRKPRDREGGQSLLEFLLMLPMMVGLVVILIRVNTAIQISIVNQQYARMHALWLNFNSAEYPQNKLRIASITSHKDNQMLIGVSSNPAPDTGKYVPEAATSYIARKRGVPDRDDPEASERANVRIRDTVTICTQINVVKDASGYVPTLKLKCVDPGCSVTTAEGSWSLSSNPQQFEYCRTSMQYVMGGET